VITNYSGIWWSKVYLVIKTAQGKRYAIPFRNCRSNYIDIKWVKYWVNEIGTFTLEDITYLEIEAVDPENPNDNSVSLHKYDTPEKCKYFLNNGY
jgi:hypothetical protein